MWQVVHQKKPIAQPRAQQPALHMFYKLCVEAMAEPTIPSAYWSLMLVLPTMLAWWYRQRAHVNRQINIHIL